MILKKILLVGGTAFCLFSCQDDIVDAGVKGKDMNVEASVKVFGEVDSERPWNDEDMIGVSIDGMADYHSETNIAFMYDAESDGFVAVKSGIILKGAERNLSAYYPFVGAENEVPETIDISTSAQWQSPQMQLANDYLFSTTTATREDPVARFDFQHVMSQMRLEFVESTGKIGELSYTLSGLVHSGSFNPYTGEIRTTTTRSEDLSLNSQDMVSVLTLLPQTAEVAVSVIFDGKTYAGVFTVDLKANECSVYKVGISPESLDASLTITSGESSDWIVGTGGDISSEDNLTVSVYEAGTLATKAFTDSFFKTHFEEGDKVGVFAVKGGTILPNVNNKCLTYDGNDWKFDSKVNYNASMRGSVFYAYYPYSDNMTLDVDAADPFVHSVEDYKTLYDQSDKTSYISCDLMTAESEPYESNGKFVLEFGMMHRMGMLSISLPRTAYVFTNTDPELEDYVLSTFDDVQFFAVLGEEPEFEIRPYFDEISQSYRLIVGSNEYLNIRCTFLKDGQPKKFNLTLPHGIQEGTCEPYKVDGGYKSISMELKVGDYYCSDGSLVSYDSIVSAPDNVVGVIYRLGTPDAVQSDESKFTHGLVYALNRQVRPVVDGDPGKYDKFPEDQYVSVFGLAQDKDYDYNSIGLTTSDHNKSDLNGYGYTKSWMLYDGAKGANALFKASLEAYRSAVAIPEELTTQWYLPSYDEFVEIANQSGVLNESLAHCDAESVFEGTCSGDKKYYRGYWTSSLRSAASVVNYYSLGEEDTNNSGIKQTGYVESRYGSFRYAFAF